MSIHTIYMSIYSLLVLCVTGGYMGFVGMHLKDHLNFDATEWILLIPIDVLEHG